jgi:hypothetical protein
MNEMIGRVKQHPEWKEIVSLLCDYEYGSTIRHEDIEAISGLSRARDHHRYFNQIKKAKKHLLRDYGRKLRAIPDKGYELVNPNEFVKESRREVIRGTRRIREAGDTLAYVPQERLSPVENRMVADAASKTGMLLAFATGTLAKTKPSLLAKRADVPKLITEEIKG